MAKTKVKKDQVNAISIEKRVVSGIKINRDRPANSGWCGAEGCAHLSHQRFNRTVGKA